MATASTHVHATRRGAARPGRRAHGGVTAAPAARPTRRPMVAPFARALALLAAFTPMDRWLGVRDLATRANLPVSTATRIARSLVQLGCLHHASDERKYRLAPPCRPSVV